MSKSTKLIITIASIVLAAAIVVTLCLTVLKPTETNDNSDITNSEVSDEASHDHDHSHDDDDSGAEECEHEWTDEVITTQPTCTETGIGTHTCAKCGYTCEYIAEALGHAWVATERVEATYETEGYTVYKCDRCGETKKDDVYGPLNEESEHTHEYGEWVVTKEATCTEDGVRTKKCDICGQEITDTVPATGHSFVKTDETVDATKTSEGYTVYRCTDCGATEHRDTTPKLTDCTHEWDEGTVTTPATCETDGVRTYTCKKCNETYTEVITKLQHHYVLTEEVTATTEHGGYLLYSCDRCNKSYKTNETPKITECEHEYAETLCIEPTCTTSGTCVLTCKKCGHQITEDTEATGHDFTLVETVAPTNTSTGYDLYRCTKCGCEEKRNEIPATTDCEHKFDEGVVTTAATCSRDGIKTFTCSKCGAVKTESIPKLGHDYVTTVIEPTYRAEGYTLHKCSRCNASYKSDTVSRLTVCPHSDYSEWVVTKEATCTETGVKSRTCNDCGYIDTAVIESTGHDYVKGATVASTTTSEGYTIYTCSKCGDEEKRDITPIAQDDTCKHDYKKKTITKGDCTTDEVIQYTCSKCGDTYTVTNKAKGHSWDSGKVTKEATCDETGIRTYTCKTCGETKTERIARTEHSYYRVKVAATCTQKGYTLYRCENCDDQYCKNYTDALGHNYDDDGWVVDYEATTDQYGCEHNTCTRCGEKIYRSIPMIGGADTVVHEVNTKIAYEPGDPSREDLPPMYAYYYQTADDSDWNIAIWDYQVTRPAKVEVLGYLKARVTFYDNNDVQQVIMVEFANSYEYTKYSVVALYIEADGSFELVKGPHLKAG